MKSNAIRWFEIPVLDMKRAMKFYETVFDVKLRIETLGPILMAWFPWDDGEEGSSGALVFEEDCYKPSMNGAVIYFSSDDVADELSRVEFVGGRVLQPKKIVTKAIGYMGVFIDSEGNRIALHSAN